jgi:hypothetical protein
MKKEEDENGYESDSSQADDFEGSASSATPTSFHSSQLDAEDEITDRLGDQLSDWSDDNRDPNEDYDDDDRFVAEDNDIGTEEEGGEDDRKRRLSQLFASDSDESEEGDETD